jgi:N-acetylglucosaminyl-diphospho-decaprenol L-rhamnosyltransferase
VAGRTIGLTSIVVVAADSGPLLLDAIGAALASDANVEVILVDNASRDRMPQRVAADRRDDARFVFVPLAENIGFGPACNRGAAIARGDALLFLNPDCVIARDTIARLRAIADEDDSIGLLGIEIVSPDGVPARGNRRRAPSLRRALMSMSGLSRFESRSPSFAGVEMPDGDAATSAPIERVEAVSGACIFLPRRVFDAVAGFDERYFLHVEDLDLCRRVIDAGYDVAIARTIRATHVQGSSSRHRPVFVSWHKHRGMWRYFTTFDRAARNVVLRAIVWCGLWAHFVATAPLLMLRRKRLATP